jgi:hypothetical protein
MNYYVIAENKRQYLRAGALVPDRGQQRNVFLTPLQAEATPVLFEGNMMIMPHGRMELPAMVPWYGKFEEGRSLVAMTDRKAAGMAKRQLRLVDTDNGGFHVQWVANPEYYIGIVDGQLCVSTVPVTVYQSAFAG